MLPKFRVSTHPGRFLCDDFLKPLGISQSALARHIGVNPRVINEICREKRNISPRLNKSKSRFNGAPRGGIFASLQQADYTVFVFAFESGLPDCKGTQSFGGERQGSRAPVKYATPLLNPLLRCY